MKLADFSAFWIQNVSSCDNVLLFYRRRLPTSLQKLVSSEELLVILAIPYEEVAKAIHVA